MDPPDLPPVDVDEPPRIAGPLPRFAPVAAGAILLMLATVIGSATREQVAGGLATGALLLGATAAVHGLALRLPRRHAVNGLAWVLTVVAATALPALIVVVAGVGR